MGGLTILIYGDVYADGDGVGWGGWANKWRSCCWGWGGLLMLMYGGVHADGDGVGGLTTLICGGVYADGDGGGWGGWANNVDMWWRS